jgi:hypothetical protein
MIRFTWLYATAWLRGLFYRWPKPVPLKGWHTGCSCSIVSWSGCLGMYRTDGQWEPWALRRVRGYGCAGWSGFFRIPMTKEKIEYEKASTAEWNRLADRHYGEERFIHETLGRSLRWDERLRHLNGDTFDCRPENMEIVSIRENRGNAAMHPEWLKD